MREPRGPKPRGFSISITAPLRSAHYHKPSDTPDNIDDDSAARVVPGVEEMTQRLANDA